MRVCVGVKKVYVYVFDASAVKNGVRVDVCVRGGHDGLDALCIALTSFTHLLPCFIDPLLPPEHKPNKNSAEWSLMSFWLGLEEAMQQGVQFPDVLFIFNGGDQPWCNKYYACE